MVLRENKRKETSKSCSIWSLSLSLSGDMCRIPCLLSCQNFFNLRRLVMRSRKSNVSVYPGLWSLPRDVHRGTTLDRLWGWDRGIPWAKAAVTYPLPHQPSGPTMGLVVDPRKLQDTWLPIQCTQMQFCRISLRCNLQTPLLWYIVGTSSKQEGEKF